MKSEKKRIFEKIIIFTLAAGVVSLLVFFLKDVFFPFIKLEINQDFDGAKELLRSKGVLGAVTVTVVEALQMVVIFIPAEFIQLSSGMSYPWYIAVPLCDLGVALGASIIFFIVRVFKFDGDIFNRRKKIEKYERKKNKNGIMIFMYFLFIMPIIPFGAICYYASNKKISYPRYIFTCATGVIPSIATSIIMGAAVKEFIANSLPLWLLILIIIGAAAILFLLILFVLNKFYFKENDGTPDSVFYGIFKKFVLFFLKGRSKIVVTGEDVKAIDGAYLMLVNHASFFDFYTVSRVDKDRNFAYVLNRHYFGMPVIGTTVKRGGFIPKRIFDADIDAVKGMMRAVKNGYPVVMFPEGRLSNSGVLNSVNKAVAPLAKKLGVPIVLVRLENAYLSKPKWRNKSIKTTITANVREIISPENAAAMTDGELYDKITETLSYNDFKGEIKYRYGKKAKGLENLLYRCADCGTLYSTASFKNDFYCKNCGKTYHIDEYYRFTDENVKDINEYYERIKDEERKNLVGLNLSLPVDAKIFFKDKNRYDKDEGTFTLTEDTVRYESKNAERSFEIPVRSLEGIAYSVNSEFEMYNGGRLHYFYPKGEKRACTRIALIYDLLKERENGKSTKAR